MSSLLPSCDTHSRAARQDTARLHRFFWSDAFALCSPCLNSHGRNSHGSVASTNFINAFYHKQSPVFFSFFIFHFLFSLANCAKCIPLFFRSNWGICTWRSCSWLGRMQIRTVGTHRHWGIVPNSLGDSLKYHMFETSKMHYAGELQDV